jgi:hypothetical protein
VKISRFGSAANIAAKSNKPKRIFGQVLIFSEIEKGDNKKRSLKFWKNLIYTLFS